MLPHVIYGPPGCGKTTELLNRLSQARARGFGANEIAYLSFTRAAANEALKRLNLTSSPKVCTLHALCFRLLGITPMQVVDYNKLRKFSQIVGVPIKGQTSQDSDIQTLEVGDQFLAMQALAINKNVALSEVYYDGDRPDSFEAFKYFIESYQSWKSANGYVDFNDMLLQYLHNPLKHGARIMFVDEAQDLSFLQWQVLDRMMNQDSVVEVHFAGDDDQAIYEWAGADTHGMAKFEEQYGARRDVLSQSWRVPSLAHGLAMRVISSVEKRVAKEYAPREVPGSVNWLSMFRTNLVHPGTDTLILCRTAASKGKIEQELIDALIPYRNTNGKPSLYDSAIADAIRIFRKLERGEKITRPEGEKLIRLANERTKAELEKEEIAGMLSRGFERSLRIPKDQIEFYREANLDQSPKVRLSTIHSAKGQEAKHVILDTTITERTEAEMFKNPDAEARVWYVAVTRTMDRLDILETPERSYPLENWSR